MGRFPAFDYQQLNGICYLRIKREVVFAKGPKGILVYVVPTDDLRLKFVIFKCAKLEGSLVDHAQNVIAGLSDFDTPMREIMLPAFSVKQT